jgi:hypothetical protein
VGEPLNQAFQDDGALGHGVVRDKKKAEWQKVPNLATPAQDVMVVAIQNKDINVYTLVSLFFMSTPIAHA